MITNNSNPKTPQTQAQQAITIFWLRLKFWYFYRSKKLSDCLEILEHRGVTGEAAITYLQGWGGQGK